MGKEWWQSDYIPFSEWDIVKLIVLRIYRQTSIQLTEEQFNLIVDTIQTDKSWVELTEKISNMIYELEK